ncbi:hypothetical protein WJX82_004975 [Trebouxia sp. C0006]
MSKARDKTAITADATEPSAGLSTTQFVMLADAQRQKNALAEQQVRFHELLEENRQLQDQHDISLRDNFEVTEFLRREIVTKDEKISLLQGKMDEVKTAAASQVAAAKQASAEAKARAAADAERRVEESRTELAQMKEQLAAVLDYKQRKEVLEEEVAKLTAELSKLRTDAAEQMSEAEQQFVNTSQRVRKEFESRLEEVRRAGEEDVHLRMDAGSKRIMQQNRSLQEELRIHIEASSELDAEVKRLSSERQRLASEVQMKREMEQQYAKRCTLQAREGREGQQKIAALERSLQQVLADFDAERQMLLQNSGQQLAEAQAESNSLKRLIKLKTQELKNIRRLSHEVLLQRSDVETFLVSSLKQVRDRIDKENVSGQPKGDLAPLPPPGHKIDIKELTWEDREKVLRLLFAKINNQAQQMYYANLPGHSFQVAEDSVETMQGLRTEAGPAQLV